MERTDASYQLPAKRSVRHLTPIECIAQTLGVPLGYMLGGFTEDRLKESCFWPKIQAGDIRLTHVIREGGLGEFLSALPVGEHELLALPLNKYRNERAFAAIFRIERIFSGLEMLLVNEPPLIFWDDEDAELWIRNMNLDGIDAPIFRAEFRTYVAHFRDLTINNRKKYQVVLNRSTFVRWLKRKSAQKRAAQLNEMEKFMKRNNFELVFLVPPQQGRSRSEAIAEREVISKVQKIPDSLQDTIAIQISQTPPDHKPTEYFLTPLHSRGYLLQEEKSQIELARAKAIEQTEQELSELVQSGNISNLSIQILNRIKREIGDS